MNKVFKRLLAVCMLQAGLASGGMALAADWPGDRPVSFVVPSAAGGSPDVLSRLITTQLSKDLDSSFVIENRPGAAGNIGIMQIVRANPDGHTIGYGNINTLAVNRALFNKLPYDVDRDLAPVVHFFNIYNVLIVPADSPIKTVQELVDHAKANPGDLSYGASGVGTTGHMGGELFKHLTKIDVLYVPYNSGPAALQDLLGGRLDFMFSNSSEAVPLVKSGRVRALGVSSKKRLPLLPDVPTVDEAGVTGYETISWGGVVAPKDTSPEIIEKLNAAIVSALKEPEVVKGLESLGAEPGGGSPADFQALIDAETAKWKDIIESAGITKLD